MLTIKILIVFLGLYGYWLYKSGTIKNKDTKTLVITSVSTFIACIIIIIQGVSYEKQQDAYRIALYKEVMLTTRTEEELDEVIELINKGVGQTTLEKALVDRRFTELERNTTTELLFELRN